MIKNILRKFILFACLFFLIGCQQSLDSELNSEPIVTYEYLSLNEAYTEEINNWLNVARKSDDEKLYGFSDEDGVEYVYAKGYTNAKVSYTYEDMDGKITSTLETTLLKGENNEELFIKITPNTEAEIVVLNAVEDPSVFYN